MARRWTTNQYMARYERRLERKAFNKMWDDVTHPPSPDGTRRCENCAKNGSCTLNRRGNHGACFVAIAEKGEQENNNEASGMSPIAVFFLVLGIICKHDNEYVIKYCSDDRIIAREYELV